MTISHAWTRRARPAPSLAAALATWDSRQLPGAKPSPCAAFKTTAPVPCPSPACGNSSTPDSLARAAVPFIGSMIDTYARRLRSAFRGDQPLKYLCLVYGEEREIAAMTDDECMAYDQALRQS